MANVNEMSDRIVFDHLHLDDKQRSLIRRACTGGTVVYLAPLDKGLSGSSVWQAQWRLRGGLDTKHHVFKIGPKDKIEREDKAIKDIASVIDRGFPYTACFFDEQNGMALLRQEFAGTPQGVAKSLRQYIEECRDPGKASDILLKLYLERMAPWHPESGEYPKHQVKLREALDWWLTKLDLRKAAQQIGMAGLENSLRARGLGCLEQLEERIQGLLGHTEELCAGPVHGDLHAQNVLITDKNLSLQLIDFGWTNQDKWKAVDFFMMECSMRFVASPQHALLDELLKMERLLDEKYNGKQDADYSELDQSIHGVELQCIAKAVHVIRHCAVRLKAVRDLEQYRAGLAVLTACLATLPSLLNRVYLFHSLAYQCSKLPKG